MAEPFTFQVVRCRSCGRDAHIEPGECDRPALCVVCSIRNPTAVCLPAAIHQPTSVAAAASMRAVAGDLHRRVLAALIAAGEAGLTDEELQQQLDMNGNTERPRRRWLEQNGFCTASQQTRKTESGRAAVVWISTGRQFESA